MRGHRLTPWRSPYLRWRLETYTGLKMEQLGFWQIAQILLHESRSMWRYLRWVGRMGDYAHNPPRNPPLPR